MFDIKELIKSEVVFIDSRCRLAEAAKLLCASDQLVLPVVNECLEPIGIVTERDVIDWLCSGKDSKAKVTDCMRTGFATIDEGAGLVDAVYIFAEQNHREIPVVSDGVLKGLIRRDTLIKYIIDRKAADEVRTGELAMVSK